MFCFNSVIQVLRDWFIYQVEPIMKKQLNHSIPTDGATDKTLERIHSKKEETSIAEENHKPNNNEKIVVASDFEF